MTTSLPPVQFMATSDVGKLKAANFARNPNSVNPKKLTRTVNEWADTFESIIQVRRTRRPLSVHDGVLYDGHHRYASARKAGTEYLQVVDHDDPRFNW